MKTGIKGVGTEGSYNLDKKDQKMSMQHLKDSLEYNMRHAEEHLQKAKEACERLHEAGEETNIPKSLLDLNEYFEEKAGYNDKDDVVMEKRLKKVGAKMAHNTKENY